MNAQAALLLAAFPLAALHGQVRADDAVSLQSLPGIDRVRLAIPDGSIAGQSVTVYELRSRRAPRDALAELEGHWRAQGIDTVLQAQAGEWFVLSRLAGAAGEIVDAAGTMPGIPGFETLQMRASPEGGSEGLLTRWDTARTGTAQHPSLAALVPDDARVVRRFSLDSAHERRAATIVAHFPRSLDDAESHLERHLLRAGFEPMRANGQARDLRWSDDRARFYRSARAELLVTLHRLPQGASAVLHYMETPR